MSYRFTYARNYTGTCITHLGSDMRMKLKVAYTLIEKLYSGTQRAICIAAHNKPPPTSIKETLEKLSMLPARLDELKRSAARAGSLTALIRAKAWIPDLDSTDVGSGYPSIKEDGSDFDNGDLRALTKEMRQLANWLKKSIFHIISRFMMLTTRELMRQLMMWKILSRQSISIPTPLMLTSPPL